MRTQFVTVRYKNCLHCFHLLSIQGGFDMHVRATRKLLAMSLVGALSVAVAGCGSGVSDSDDSVGNGITEPVKLPPFEPSDEVGEKPDLPRRISFAAGSTTEVSLGEQAGLKLGAKDAGLEFSTANADGDPQKHVANMEQFLVQGTGALVTDGLDQAAQAPVVLKAIDKGVATMNLIFGPATNQVNASQYSTGEVLGEIAAKFINDNLNGQANVVLFNQDSAAPLVPRFQAIRDVLGEIPGVKIVADVTTKSFDADGGYKAMNTVMQKNPNIDVVLSGDAVIQGALAALQAAGKEEKVSFMGSTDGTQVALDTIRKGGPWKVTVALSPPIFGYAWARYAADWLDGKSIPQAIDVKPIPLTSPESIATYEEDSQNPDKVWEDPARLSKYLEMLGSISYETRGDFLAYSWTPDEVDQ